MIIVEDTRNQINKHKNKREWFKNNNIACIRSKLYCGDYARLNNQSVCIDTKKNWQELAGNICGKQHERFRNECIRAKNANIQLIILVEQECSVLEWNCPNKHSKNIISLVRPDVLYKAMKTMTEKYNVIFIHCAKEHAAETIYKILKGAKNGRD